MAFSWTTVTPGTTKFDGTHFNEIKVAVDHLTSQYSLSAWSWINLPVVHGVSIIKEAQVDELQNAIDYVYANSCTTKNASTNSAAHPGDDVTVDTGQKVTNYTTPYNSSVQAAPNNSGYK